jgi:hypothetical protein
MTPGRRRALLTIRWLSLPMALFCLGAPLWSLLEMYSHYDGMTLTDATVISATLASAGSKGMGAVYDVYARYPVNGRPVTANVSITVSLHSITPGDHIKIFVDPKTGYAQDDDRSDSWLMVAFGAAAAAFFALLAFPYSGKLLRP